ncbi:hypothetical protein ACWCO3_15300 [Micromonospora sp. NPDC002411]
MKAGSVLDRNLVEDQTAAPETVTPADREQEEPRPTKSADSPTTDNIPPVGGGGGNQLVRVTVNLTPRSYSALERASELTGDNRTDTINRALLVYSLIKELSDQGGGSLTILNNDGEKERIHIL